jgi:hypothetical protein
MANHSAEPVGFVYEQICPRRLHDRRFTGALLQGPMSVASVTNFVHRLSRRASSAFIALPDVQDRRAFIALFMFNLPAQKKVLALN